MTNGSSSPATRPGRRWRARSRRSSRIRRTHRRPESFRRCGPTSSAGRSCFAAAYDIANTTRHPRVVPNTALQLFTRSVLWAYTGSRERDSAMLRQMSTIDHVTSEFPPTFISGGNADPLTDAHSRPFAAATRRPRRRRHRALSRARSHPCAGTPVPVPHRISRRARCPRGSPRFRARAHADVPMKHACPLRRGARTVTDCAPRCPRSTRRIPATRRGRRRRARPDQRL